MVVANEELEAGLGVVPDTDGGIVVVCGVILLLGISELIVDGGGVEVLRIVVPVVAITGVVSWLDLRQMNMLTFNLCTNIFNSIHSC
jgi:hypothetical protein